MPPKSGAPKKGAAKRQGSKDSVASKASKAVKDEEEEVKTTILATPPALFEYGLATRKVRENLYEKRVDPDAMLECLQADTIDMELVEQVMDKEGVQLNYKDQTFGWTPLLCAANKGLVEVLALLLAAKVKPVLCNNGNSAVHFAARGGHVKAVHFLISKKFDLDVRNSNGWTPLMWAAEFGRTEVALSLIQAQADIALADEDGCTAAMWAARHGHMQILKALLEKGFDLEVRDKQGLRVVDHAQNYLEIKRDLMERDQANHTLLAAAERNDTALARQALAAGAQANVSDDTGWSALTWSMMHGSLEIVKLLAVHNADPGVIMASTEVLADFDFGEGSNVKEELSETVRNGLESRDRLLNAARADNWPLVEEELAGGALINQKENESLLTCFMFATIYCNQKMCSRLVELQANPHLRDAGGWAALHYAVQSGSLGLVSLLSHLSCDFLMITYEGMSPLHLAARTNDAAMVLLLAAASCKVSEEDIEDLQPLQLACKWGSDDAAQALIACDAWADRVDRHKRNLLHLAAMHGHVSTLERVARPPKPLPEICDPKQLAAGGPELELLQVACRMRELINANEPEYKLCGKDVPGRKAPLRIQANEIKLERPKDKDDCSPFMTPDGSPRSPKGKAKAKAKRKKKQEVESSSSSESEDVDVVPYRPSERPNLGEKDGFGYDAMMLAAIEWHPDVVSRILDWKGDVELAVPDSGKTLLMLAAEHGELPLLQKLIGLGAERGTALEDGRTVLDFAKKPPIKMFLELEVIKDQLADPSQTSPKAQSKAAAKPPPKPPPKPATDSEAEAEAEAEAEGDEELEIYRCRIEGIPPLLYLEDTEEHLRKLLRRLKAIQPVNVFLALDPITQRPLGYAHVDFATMQEAKEVYRASLPREFRLATRNVRVINEGRRYLPPAGWGEQEEN